MNIPKEIQELRANIEILRTKYQEVKAMPPGKMGDDMDMDDDKMGKMKEIEDMMMDMMGYTNSRITYLEDAFYSFAETHRKGHLPAVNSAAQMEHCLEVLGLSNDYQVYKPMISVAKERYGFEVK